MSATNPVTLPANWSQATFLARVVVNVNKIESLITLTIADETIQGVMLELKGLYKVWLPSATIMNYRGKREIIIKWCQNSLTICSP